MTNPLKILILEDSPYLQALDEFGPFVILSDPSLPQFDSKLAATKVLLPVAQYNIENILKTSP